MILDQEATLTTATGFDLESVRPGPGNPIKMIVIGMTADTDVAITTGADAAEAEAGLTALTTVTTNGAGFVEFELPSNAQQFIAATFAAGGVYVTLPGNQTAV